MLNSLFHVFLGSLCATNTLVAVGPSARQDRATKGLVDARTGIEIKTGGEQVQAVGRDGAVLWTHSVPWYYNPSKVVLSSRLVVYDVGPNHVPPIEPGRYDRAWRHHRNIEQVILARDIRTGKQIWFQQTEMVGLPVAATYSRVITSSPNFGGPASGLNLITFRLLDSKTGHVVSTWHLSHWQGGPLKSLAENFEKIDTTWMLQVHGLAARISSKVGSRRITINLNHRDLSHDPSPGRGTGPSRNREVRVKVLVRDDYLLVRQIPLGHKHFLSIKFSSVEENATPPYEFSSGARIKMFIDASKSPVSTAFLPNVYNAAKLADVQVGFIDGRCFLALGALAIDNYWKAIFRLDLRRFKLRHMLTVDRGDVDFSRGLIHELVKDRDVYDQWPSYYHHVIGANQMISQLWTYSPRRKTFVGKGYVFPRK